MAKGVNKVFLLGNVGKDPEIRSTQGGTVVASFSLATADREKDSSGEWIDKTEWHNLVCFQRTAEVVRDYVKKGSQILVEGKIQTRSWEDKSSGEKKYRTEVICNELTLLGGKSEGGSTSKPATQTRATPTSQTRTTTPTETRSTSNNSFGDLGITEDDIPF